MDFIWLGLSLITLWLISWYEDKIGRNGHLYHFLLFVVLVFIGILLWDILGLDSGGGGSPYGDFSDF